MPLLQVLGIDESTSTIVTLTAAHAHFVNAFLDNMRTGIRYDLLLGETPLAEEGDELSIPVMIMNDGDEDATLFIDIVDVTDPLNPVVLDSWSDIVLYGTTVSPVLSAGIMPNHDLSLRIDAGH